MLKSKNHEHDCTRKCNLRTHGNNITAALTKRSLPDDKLAAYLAKTCCNFPDVLDDLGRSAVHLSASVDRYAILEWLINHGAKIDVGDYESGSTALHRAIFYGCIDCAVLLLRYGASLDMQDADTCCPLQNACRLMDFPATVVRQAETELLVWGSNKNYNLGIGIEDGPNSPQAVDFFRKGHICITKVAIGSFHSLFLDAKGQLYAAGHGKGGRLGNSTENSLAAPKKVKVPIKNSMELITDIAVSSKHSLVLTNCSSVFTCGLNEDKQLGVRGDVEKLTVFKEVISLRDLRVENLERVIARDYYSLVHSSTFIYYWGRNLGQFGVDANIEIVSTPTQLKLPKDALIKSVECNNAAIVILTQNGNVVLYNNGKMRWLNPPNFQPLKFVHVHGGDSLKYAKGSPSALKLLMVEETNGITFWYEKTRLYYRCDFSQIRLTQIDKLIYKGNQMLILSHGNVYQGKCVQVPVPKYYTDASKSSSWSAFNSPQMADFCNEHMMRVELQRLPNVDRVLNICGNEDFSSFAVLQEGSYKYFKAPTLPKEPYNFKKLHTEVHLDDTLHDVVFIVDGESFPAHKLLIYARAPGLRDIVRNSLNEQVHLKFEHLNSKMFDLLLKYIYVNYLPTTEDLADIQQSLGPDSSNNLCDVCQLFLTYVEKFQMNELASYLKSYLNETHLAYLARFRRLRRTDFPELYDVRIICAGDIELSAHKCILVARLDYFDMMFTHNWAEQSVISLTTTPIEYMQPLVDFIYSYDEDHFRKQNYTESFLYNMIVLCDQFLFERLRKVCESLLVDKLSIRKCGDILDFACIYNCELLRSSCIDFICQNLVRVLCYRSLENCEKDSLKYINAQYRAMFKQVFDYRIITPDFAAIEDELLLSFVDDFHADLEYRVSESESNSNNMSAKTKTPQQRSARQHERDAITSMMKSLNLTESEQKSNNGYFMSKVLREAQEIDEKLHQESKSWMRVVDKKEQKHKQWRETGVICNKLLKPEAANKDMVPLVIEQEKHVATKTDIDIETKNLTAVNRSFNLAAVADFTPSREKLSQKQRKRLSSITLNSPTAVTLTGCENAIVASSPPNAWGLLPAADVSAELSSPTTGSLADPDSFANMLRITNSPAKKSASGNSLLQIQAEERKEREHYERMRSKSLALTQIEETAITELRSFYNVDNVTDEIITIERKPMPCTLNFAVWQRN